MVLEELNRKKEYYARRYPNVDVIVGLTHDSGCGLVTLSEGHLQQNRTIQNLIRVTGRPIYPPLIIFGHPSLFKN